MSADHLILIADDYAISPAVSAGIRSLAEAGRLTGTGVMASMGSWPNEAAALKRLSSNIEVGLHFTLTDQTPLGDMPRLAPFGRLPSVGRLIQLCLTGRLPRQEIADEFERQLQSFERHFGAPPQFIDGHQHVHLLPGIWPIVQGAFGAMLDPRRCWLRDCCDFHFLGRGSKAKAGLVTVLGAAASRAAKNRGLHTNSGFTGFYDYQGSNLAANFAGLLKNARNGCAMMVHPGHVDAPLRAVDGLTDAREEEWRFLASDDFPKLLAATGFRLAPPGFAIDAAMN